MDVSQHWQDICHAIQEGVFLVDPDGTIVMANEGLARITGYTRDELMGRSCRALGCAGCESVRRGGGGAWCALFAGDPPGPRRCVLTRKDGSQVAVFKNQSCIRDASGRVVGAVESLLDLTELDRLDRKVAELSRLLDRPDAFQGMVGRSAPMRRLFDILEKAAASEAPVLLLGESGTGKELAAQALHALGPRAGGPFVGVNCAALSETLLESELFGHAKGAFTGAVRARQGRFEAAQGGDLFLDEIGDTPLSTQVKLLRVLETGLMERVGEDRPRRVSARLITATNRNLAELVATGRFREDFFFRIAVIPIVLPPLRDRREDIPLLVEHFLHVQAARTGRPQSGIAPEALDSLVRHAWPGNVRELRSALEYAVVLAGAGAIGPEHLPAGLGCDPAAAPWPLGLAAAAVSGEGAPDDTARDKPARAPGGSPGDGGRTGPSCVLGLPAAGPVRASGPPGSGGAASGLFDAPCMDGVPASGDPSASAQALGDDPHGERAALVAALTRAGGNKALAARLLGVNRLTVYNRMRKWGLAARVVLTG